MLAIKRKIKSVSVFNFDYITKEDVIKEIKNLDASKHHKKMIYQLK